MRKRLSQITPMDVHEALKEIASGDSPREAAGSSTVAQVHRPGQLPPPRRALRHTRNAARLAKPVAHQHGEVDPFRLEEARALLEQVGEYRLGSLFTVALSLGLRQGECVGLQWEDVDLEASPHSRASDHPDQRAPRGRGDPSRRSRRSLILPSVCVDQLARHREHRRSSGAALVWDDRGLVWPSETGTPLTVEPSPPLTNRLTGPVSGRVSGHDRPPRRAHETGRPPPARKSARRGP
jgi:integrase